MTAPPRAAARANPAAAVALGLAFAASAGCVGRPAHRAPGPVASALLAFAAEHGTPPADVARTWADLEAIAAAAAARPRRAGEDLLDSVVAELFVQRGFARDVDHTDVSLMLLPPVVAARKGSCVGLGALVLAIGERLDLPVEGVLVPGHFFVRLRGPRARNVELLRRGEAMPDAWYAKKYGPWAASATAYMRGLAPDELIAVHAFNVGNARREVHDLAGAEGAYADAARAFPAFAEAQASLGMVRQLRGELGAAESAYAVAARARPDLPGLAQNRSLLDVERGARQDGPAPGLAPAVSPRTDETAAPATRAIASRRSPP